MSDQLFWDIGLVVVQEAVFMTVLCLAGFYLIRGLFQGLTYLSNASKPQAWAARTAALVPAAAFQEAPGEEPETAEHAEAAFQPAVLSVLQASGAAPPAPQYAACGSLVEACR